MKKTITLTLFSLVMLFVACRKKNVDCDATVCVTNNSADTVWYCWGCNSYSEYIAPGSQACRPVGHIKIKHGLFANEESTTDVFFNSSSATYQIPVDECNEVRIIE